LSFVFCLFGIVMRLMIMMMWIIIMMFVIF
jgi:hypothetical protein